MQTNSTAIQQIVQAIDITPQRRVLLHGRPFDEEFSNPYVQQPSNKMLFQSLQNLIYTVFYSQNKAGEAAHPAGAPSYREIERFIDELSAENSSVESFDNGWFIDYVDAQGTIIARKGNYTRPIFHGEFLNSSGFHHSPMVGQSIRLLARKEHKDPASGFYYVFGNSLAEDNPDQLVRIYFHIQPAGIKQLIRSLTELLNRYEVPFNFKCVNHPSFFTRCDAAVLYFDKRFSTIVFQLLEEVYAGIKNHLVNEVPLFTKALAKGLAFAENPRKPDESFGTHISKMLAQGIMNALSKNAPKQYWVQEIKWNIEQQHQYKNIEQLYLNPDSVFPYSFPYFSN